MKLLVRVIKIPQITLTHLVTLSLMRRAIFPCTRALKGNAKNTESLTGTMPGTTLRDNFLLSATRALASLAAPEQMEPETSAETLLLCLLKASWIRHNRSQDNATVLQGVLPET